MRYRGFPNIQAGLDDPLVASKLGFAKSLVGIAQKIQGETKKAFVHLKREVDGVAVEALVFHNQSIITMRRASGEEESGSLVSRLLWVPEGLNLRLLNFGSMEGYGLPFDSENPFGTPGGPVRDVLINRFENNLYPDSVTAFGAVDPATYFFVVKHEDSEISVDEMAQVGLYLTAGAVERQFSNYAYDDAAGFVELVVFEEEGGVWHCHRPTPLPYQSPFLKGVFDRTNAVRNGLSLPLVYPPFRGWSSASARDVVTEMVRTRQLAHSSDFFTPGHKYPVDRIMKRVGAPRYSWNYYGENLRFSGSDTSFTEENGSAFVDAWAGSPEHYAMIAFDWTDGKPEKVAGILDIAVARGRLEGVQSPPYALDSGVTVVDPPASGLYATQVFSSVKDFVGSAPAFWEGAEGRVSWHGTPWYMHSNPSGFYWDQVLSEAYYTDTPEAREAAGWMPDTSPRAFDFEASPGALTTSYLPAYRNGPQASTIGRVYLNGRVVEVFNFATIEEINVLPIREVRGAGLSRTDDDKLQLNVLILIAPRDGNLPCSLQLLTKVLSDPGEPDARPYDEFTVAAEYELPLLTEAVSGATFSESGERCVITAYVLVENEVPHLWYHQWDFGSDVDPGDDISNSFGSEAVFIEFFEGAGSVVLTERVTISAECGRGTTEYATPRSIEDPVEYPDDGDKINWYRSSCIDTYKLLATYSGETLQYFEVEIDFETDQAVYVEEPDTEWAVGSPDPPPVGCIALVGLSHIQFEDKTLIPILNSFRNKTTLIFPDAGRLDCVDLEFGGPSTMWPVEPGPHVEGFSVSGSVVQFAHLGKSLGESVYARLDADATDSYVYAAAGEDPASFAEKPIRQAKVDVVFLHGETEFHVIEDFAFSDTYEGYGYDGPFGWRYLISEQTNLAQGPWIGAFVMAPNALHAFGSRVFATTLSGTFGQAWVVTIVDGGFVVRNEGLASVTVAQAGVSVPKEDYAARITPNPSFCHFPRDFASAHMHFRNKNMLPSISPHIQPSADFVAHRAVYKGEHVVAVHVANAFMEFPFTSKFKPGPAGVEEDFPPLRPTGIDRFITDSSLDLSVISGIEDARVGFAGVVG